VDVVLLSTDPARYVERDDWLDEVGAARLVRTLPWGAVTERRFALPSGLEVELGVGTPSWASVDPVDAGTCEVVTDGIRVLYDPDGMLAELVAACRRTTPTTLPLQRHESLDERFDPAIRIVEYDPRWPVRAKSELDRIRRALGPLAVRLEHVGSTAVPDLAAKPIVDLQLAVPAIEQRSQYVAPLERLDYLFAPSPESPDLHFFAKPPERPRSYHLHVCGVDSDHEFRHLAVRDYLRSHRDEAERYAALKRGLVRRHPQDRLAYIAGKEQYVTELDARACAWASALSE
jgi:GrpB-like predicted nucleotidyltransferase (UPF0157 family)